MKLKFLFCLPFVLISFLGNAQTYASSNFTLISNISPETTTNSYGDKYSGCWGWYQASKNKEYAIACSHKGIYWVDVTNPSTPTVSAYQTGSRPNCIWREVKTYQNYCYVISDDPAPNSFQIFDMQYLPDSVVKVHDNDSIFERAHTLWQDGDKLYVSSVTYSTGGGTYSSFNIYSLANPKKPTLLRQLNQDYSFITQVHDTYARHDTLYVSAAYQGLYIFKYSAFTNTFTQLGSLTTYSGSGYNHSSALTPDGKTLIY
jgi:hypothetical protein